MCFHAIPNREPDTVSVTECCSALRALDPDLVIAVGGGSTMDSAKVARLMLANEGTADELAGWDRDYLEHHSRLVCVPTTAGTASEVSEMAVVSLSGSDIKLRYRSQDMAAHQALLDPELLVGLPATVTANTGFDALTHALESYVSRLASPLTDPVAWEALRRLIRWLPVSFREPANVVARGECLIGSMQAGFVFNSTQLGLAHALSAPLGAMYHVIHGVGNALVLPAVVAFNECQLGPKRNRLLELFGTEHVFEGIAAIRRDLELDLGLAEFVPNSGLSELAVAALKSGNIPTNPRTPSEEDVLRILDHSREPLGHDSSRLTELELGEIKV